MVNESNIGAIERTGSNNGAAIGRIIKHDKYRYDRCRHLEGGIYQSHEIIMARDVIAIRIKWILVDKFSYLIICWL